MSEKTAEQIIEDLITSVDIIAAKRISELAFDKTIICTITDASKKANGIYTVTDGSTTFEAYSDNSLYIKNSQVYVTIPKGDYTQKKIIIGRYVAEEDITPMTYVAASDRLAHIGPNLLGNASEQGYRLLINQDGNHYYDYDKDKWVPQSEADDQGWLTISEQDRVYDSILLKVDAKCSLSTYQMYSGAFGVGVEIKLAGTGQTVTMKLDSTKDMFGNPYAFSSFYSHEQSYKLPDNVTIEKIRCYIYQNNNFKYIDPNGEILLIPSAFEEYVEFKNIELRLAYDAATAVDKSVRLISFGSTDYSLSDYTRELDVVWFNKDADGRYIGFNDMEYNAVCSKDPSKILKENEGKLYYSIELNINNQNSTSTIVSWNKHEQETYQLSCLTNLMVTEVAASVWVNGIKYESPSSKIRFNNISITNNEIINQNITLSLIHADGSNKIDHYSCYGEDNQKISTDNISTSGILQFAWSYDRGIVEDIYWKDATVKWTIPNEFTMLRPSETGVYEKTVVLSSEAYDDDILKNDYKTFSFFISDTYNENYVNNTITCEVTVPDKGTLTASKTFTFSSRGVSGTTYSLVIKDSNNNDYAFTGGDVAKLQATLFNADGKPVSSKDKYRWAPQIESCIVVADTDDTSKATVSNLSSNKYNVVQVTTDKSWAGSTKRLSTLSPITYSKNGEYYAQAPFKILYNDQGRCSIGSTPALKLYTKTVNNMYSEVDSVTWTLEYYNKDGKYYIDSEKQTQFGIEDTNTAELKRLMSGLLSLVTDEDTSEVRISRPQIFMQPVWYTVLVATVADEVVWSHPLIIEQYSYGSDTLNNWDETFILDEKNNRVLASAFAAGSKDGSNQFNGVLLGEIGNIDDSSNQTGLYGYSKGVQSFGFSNDGTAFIGKSGKGQIMFDGNGAKISDANGNMEIDLDTGTIKAENFNLDSGKLFLYSSLDLNNDNQPYMRIGEKDESDEDNSYIELANDGNLTINSKQFKLSGGEARFSGSIAVGTVKKSDSEELMPAFEVLPNGDVQFGDRFLYDASENELSIDGAISADRITASTEINTKKITLGNLEAVGGSIGGIKIHNNSIASTSIPIKWQCEGWTDRHDEHLYYNISETGTPNLYEYNSYKSLTGDESTCDSEAQADQQNVHITMTPSYPAFIKIKYKDKEPINDMVTWYVVDSKQIPASTPTDPLLQFGCLYSGIAVPTNNCAEITVYPSDEEITLIVNYPKQYDIDKISVESFVAYIGQDGTACFTNAFLKGDIRADSIRTGRVKEELYVVKELQFTIVTNKTFAKGGEENYEDYLIKIDSPTDKQIRELGLKLVGENYIPDIIEDSITFSSASSALLPGQLRYWRSTVGKIEENDDYAVFRIRVWHTGGDFTKVDSGWRATIQFTALLQSNNYPVEDYSFQSNVKGDGKTHITSGTLGGWTITSVGDIISPLTTKTLEKLDDGGVQQTSIDKYCQVVLTPTGMRYQEYKEQTDTTPTTKDFISWVNLFNFFKKKEAE